MLVLSTVHQADDPRVRVRTVGVLAQRFDVRYATPGPPPRDQRDHHWVRLSGGRARRHLAAIAQAFRPDVGLLSVHDPELIPLALAVSALRRIPVVLDVHEDVPAQLLTKAWIPRSLRPLLAAIAALLLHVAERHIAITLAEPGYARLFHQQHPVLPNYPLTAQLPAPTEPVGDVVYVGDVTEARGAALAIDAVARMQVRHRLRLIGRCAPRLRVRLEALAARQGVELDLPGFLPHDEAMAAVATAVVGLCPLEDQPNYRFSLPTKVLEYLSLGVPVVASDLPGTAAVAAGRPGVQLVPPRSVDAWSAALDRAVGEPVWRLEAARAAHDVRAQFRWPGERLLATYARLWRAPRRASDHALVG
ncbi:MAG: glycosyltransferase [Actinobacteria bacterium]|nr:glycosyltransferase [Actinomycetota bacterium]